MFSKIFVFLTLLPFQILMIAFLPPLSYTLLTGVAAPSAYQRGFYNLRLLTQSPKELWIGLFLLLYVANFINSAFRFREINTVINLLHEYLNSFSPQNSVRAYIDFSQQSSAYSQELLDVLRNYPTICKYESIYITPMKYGQSDSQNYLAARDHYNYLLMRRNFLYKDLKYALNPLRTFKSIFFFPSFLMKWIGFKPKAMTSKLLSACCWLFVYFLGLYNDEIKALISLLFQHLFHT